MVPPHSLSSALPEPAGTAHGGGYFKAWTAEQIHVKSDHQNRLLYVEYHVLSPVSMPLVVTEPRLPVDSQESSCTDAEHHCGIRFVGFNKQKVVVSWQQV